jgi:hypothetical protein
MEEDSVMEDVDTIREWDFPDTHTLYNGRWDVDDETVIEATPDNMRYLVDRINELIEAVKAEE